MKLVKKAGKTKLVISKMEWKKLAHRFYKKSQTSFEGRYDLKEDEKPDIYSSDDASDHNYEVDKTREEVKTYINAFQSFHGKHIVVKDNDDIDSYAEGSYIKDGFIYIPVNINQPPFSSIIKDFKYFYTELAKCFAHSAPPDPHGDDVDNTGNFVKELRYKKIVQKVKNFINELKSEKAFADIFDTVEDGLLAGREYRQDKEYYGDEY